MTPPISRRAPRALIEEYRRLEQQIELRDQEIASGSDPRPQVAHIRQFTRNRAARKRQILQQLITSERMNKSWLSLAKQTAKGWELEFLNACWWALQYYPTETKKTVADNARELAELARLLAIELQKGGVLPDSLYTLVPETDLPWPAEEAMGFDYVFIDTAPEDFAGPHSVPDNHGSCRPTIVLPGHARLSTVLERLAEHVEGSAAAHARDPFTITKPGGHSAPRTYCIRWLSHFMRTTFGRRLDPAVADTCAVLLDDPSIDASLVRKNAP